MSVTAGWLLLNCAYLIYAVSGLFKDMLRLRVVWMTATFFFIAHGIVDKLWPAVWWNIPVLIVHAWMISSLLRQRRGVDLDEEAEAIRTLIFPGLDRVSFNAMWHCGEERVETASTVLILKDRPVDDLMLIIDGEVNVKVRDDYTVNLSEYRLIGELSMLQNRPATATVTTVAAVRLRTWNKRKLATTIKDHPAIEVALLKAIGQDVARKLS